MIHIETLASVRLFHGLSMDKLHEIQSILTERSFAQGDYIITEDTFGDEMYLLYNGTVLVTKELIKGIDCGCSKEKVLATLKADSLPTFGENGLLGHGARTANVIAHTNCILYTLTKADFAKFAQLNLTAAYQIMVNIASILSDRLHDTDNNLVKLATAFYIAVQR